MLYVMLQSGYIRFVPCFVPGDVQLRHYDLIEEFPIRASSYLHADFAQMHYGSSKREGVCGWPCVRVGGD